MPDKCVFSMDKNNIIIDYVNCENFLTPKIITASNQSDVRIENTTQMNHHDEWLKLKCEEPESSLVSEENSTKTYITIKTVDVKGHFVLMFEEGKRPFMNKYNKNYKNNLLWELEVFSK